MNVLSQDITLVATVDQHFPESAKQLRCYCRVFSVCSLMEGRFLKEHRVIFVLKIK